MIAARWGSVSAGRGKVFQVRVFEKRSLDSKRPPIARCQVMNAEDEMAAKASPSGSSALKFASPQTTSGPNMVKSRDVV